MNYTQKKKGYRWASKLVNYKPIKKKKEKKYVSVITDMIKKEPSKGKTEILIELKKLNKEAYVEMRKHFFEYKNKYRVLQKTTTWKKARLLLIDYFTYDGILQCSKCSKVIDFRSANLHHKEYKDAELFTPFFVEFIHPRCHSKTHFKKFVKQK